MAQQMDDASGRSHDETRAGAIPAVGGGQPGNGVSALDAAAEDTYWREHYLRRPYTDETLSFDHYRPAYRYGWESRTRYSGRRWDEVERDLEHGWRGNRGTSRLGWTDAKLAARDAWQRADRLLADLALLQDAD